MILDNNKNKEDELFEIYKSTFKAVHASDELKGMVENMAGNKRRILSSTLKKAAAVAAIVAIAFTTGNAATYAATGNNIFEMISIKINGEKKDDFKLEKKNDMDGTSHYEGSYETEDSKFHVWISEDAAEGKSPVSYIVVEEGTESTGENQLEIEVGK